ncbi:MAG: hypothetical protein WDN01_15385 [Rhizomicrobium sp.]
MTVTDWIQLLLLGCLCGVVGQGIRVAIGIKKLNNASAAAAVLAGADSSQVFDAAFKWSDVLLSLLYGAVAGALAAVVLELGSKGPPAPDPKTILGLIAAGYSGVDFIEGVMKKELPTANLVARAQALRRP